MGKKYKILLIFSLIIGIISLLLPFIFTNSSTIINGNSNEFDSINRFNMNENQSEVEAKSTPPEITAKKKIKVSKIPLSYKELKKLCSFENVGTDPTTCYSEYLIGFSEKVSFQSSQELLSNFAEFENGMKGRCHSTGHIFGKWAFKKYRLEILDNIKDICGFSVGHGYMQEAATLLSSKEYIENFSSFCSKSLDIASCVHGMGHGLRNTSYTVKELGMICNDIQNKLIKKSHNEGEYAILCGEGFAMEDILLDSERWRDANNELTALSFCKDVTGYAKLGCQDMAYRNFIIAPALYEKNNNVRNSRIKGYISYCKKKNDLPHTVCSVHLGYILGEGAVLNLVNSNDSTFVEKSCQSINFESCLGSYISSILSNSNWDNTSSLKFCSLISEKNRNLCRDKVKEFLKKPPL